jgi:hypothetical protein
MIMPFFNILAGSKGKYHGRLYRIKRLNSNCRKCA